MKAYFITLLVASVVGAVCSMLAGGAFEKYVKYVAALICVVVVLLPLRGLFGKGVRVPETDDGAQTEEPSSGPDLVAAMTEQKTKDYIRQIVFGEFGIYPTEVIIKMNWSESEGVIEGITVRATGVPEEEREKIAEFLRRQLGGEVTVGE